MGGVSWAKLVGQKCIGWWLWRENWPFQCRYTLNTDIMIQLWVNVTILKSKTQKSIENLCGKPYSWCSRRQSWWGSRPTNCIGNSTRGDCGIAGCSEAAGASLPLGFASFFPSFLFFTRAYHLFLHWFSGELYLNPDWFYLFVHVVSRLTCISPCLTRLLSSVYIISS